MTGSYIAWTWYAISQGPFTSLLTSLQSNEYFSQQQIWKQENEHLKGPTLALTREALRIVATLLQPFLPERAPMLLDWIGVPEGQRSLMWATFGAVQGIQPHRRQIEKQLFEAIKTAGGAAAAPHRR